MAGPARPSIEVDGTLDDAEWLELFHESLRLESFWPRLVVIGVVAVTAGALTGLFGAPLAWIGGGAVAVLAVLGTFAAGYVWLGPRLRRRQLAPDERASRWRISADRIVIVPSAASAAPAAPVDVAWRDVDRVRVTRRLVTFELTGGRGLFALPRRNATELGESLVLGWAEDAGTPVSRAPRP